MSRIETASVQEWMRYWAERAPQLLSNLPAGTSAMAPAVHYSQRLIPYVVHPPGGHPEVTEPLQRTIDQVPELAGVFAITTGGPETGQSLIDHADAICFTGSVNTGRKVAVQAASNFIPAFLELGGKDAAIVLASAGLENAANAILRSAAGMTGQACQSLERIYVHESVYQEFVDLLVAKAQKLQAPAGCDPDR